MDSNIIDLDVYASENTNGSIKEHVGADAIKNAFTFWILSVMGERIYNPIEGGLLDSSVFKNFTDDNAELIRFKLKSAIISKFSPTLIPRKILVTPNYTERVWEIYIYYYIPELDVEGIVEVYPKDISDSINLRNPIQVTFVGDNLTNFVLLKLDELQGKSIVYDSNTGYWTWDTFQFVGFDSTSSNFSTITNLING